MTDHISYNALHEYIERSSVEKSEQNQRITAHLEMCSECYTKYIEMLKAPEFAQRAMLHFEMDDEQSDAPELLAFSKDEAENLLAEGRYTEAAYAVMRYLETAYKWELLTDGAYDLEYTRLTQSPEVENKILELCDWMIPESRHRALMLERAAAGLKQLVLSVIHEAARNTTHIISEIKNTDAYLRALGQGPSVAIGTRGAKDGTGGQNAALAVRTPMLTKNKQSGAVRINFYELPPDLCASFTTNEIVLMGPAGQEYRGTVSVDERNWLRADFALSFEAFQQLPGDYRMELRPL